MPQVAGEGQTMYRDAVDCYMTCFAKEKTTAASCEWSLVCPNLAMYCNQDCSLQARCIEMNQCHLLPNGVERWECSQKCAVSMDGDARYQAVSRCADHACHIGGFDACFCYVMLASRSSWVAL
jgi:hypothetical protein